MRSQFCYLPKLGWILGRSVRCLEAEKCPQTRQPAPLFTLSFTLDTRNRQMAAKVDDLTAAHQRVLTTARRL